MDTKFVIVGAPRTGSTLMVRTLNTINGVICHGELLQDLVRGLQDGFEPILATEAQRQQRMQRLVTLRNNDPVGFVQRALDSHSGVTGMKVLYKAFLNPDWSPVIEYINNREDLRYVHIRRTNGLRRYISESIKNAGGPIHSGVVGRSDKATAVHVDIDMFQQSQSIIKQQDESVTACIANRPVLDISYEQLCSSFRKTMSEVCHYLGIEIDVSSIEPALQKVGEKNLRMAVNNYDELIEHATTREMLLRD